MTRALACLLLACCLPLTAVEELPPLRARAEAKLVLSNGEELPGELVRQLDDGTVVFLIAGDSLPVRYQRGQYRRLVQPISPREIIERRHEILLAPDAGDQSVELLRTIRWGLEQGEDVEGRAAVLALARETAGRFPDNTRIVELVVNVLKDEPAMRTEVEQLVRQGLAANPAWSDGYRVLAELLLAQDRQQDLVAMVEEWLERQPTSYQANLMMARHAEATGQLSTAREAYFKALTFHQDMDAGLGYARLSLRLGHLDAASESASKLIEAGSHTVAAGAIQGVVLVHQGADEAATPLLERALDGGQVEGELLELTRYNLGLALYRQDRPAEALQRWRAGDGAGSRLAVAIAERRPIDLGSLGDERLRAVARELNACLALEAKRYDEAREHLTGGISERHLFLNHVADMLAGAANEDSMATLATHQGEESLRWQIYGHLLAGRLDEAQRLLDRLPQDDGYAGVCRVYVAEGRNQSARARQLFQALDGAEGVPQQYLAKLADRFGSEDDELRSYDFDWPEGYNLSQGWSAKNSGTGILIAIEDGRLVFAGTQTPAPDAVSRAWCLVSPGKLAKVSAILDLSAIDRAAAGIELLDEAQANGLAYGVLADGGLAWRQLSDGRWGSWQRLERQIQGSRAELELAYDARLARVLALIDDDQVAIGQDVRLATSYLCVGIFGTAEPGVQWRLAAEELELQLKPIDGQAGAAPDRSRRSRR